MASFPTLCGGGSAAIAGSNHGSTAARQASKPAMAALPPPHKVGKDAKTRLQEWLQGRQKPLPVYTLLSESGEEHAKQFRVRCELLQPPLATEGEGGSRRAAEQIAADAALALVDPPRGAR